MTDNLDKKLRDILYNMLESYGVDMDEYHSSHFEQEQEITQAFIDHHWRDESEEPLRWKDGDLMTGQDWYDRFKKNLEYQTTDFGEFGKFVRPDYVDFAAKKAAGINLSEWTTKLHRSWPIHLIRISVDTVQRLC